MNADRDKSEQTEPRRTYGIDYGTRIIELTTWDDEPVLLTLSEAQRQVWDDGGALVVRRDSDGKWVPAPRWPFDPPYTSADLPELDRQHVIVGLGLEWMDSAQRAKIAARPSPTTETPEPHTDPTETREDAREAHSDVERAGKYRCALQSDYCDCGACESQLAAVMAVADAETAELRAEVEQLRDVAAEAHSLGRTVDRLERGWRVSDEALREATERAVAAEAEVERLRTEMGIDARRTTKAERMKGLAEHYRGELFAMEDRADTAERALAVERARVARAHSHAQARAVLWHARTGGDAERDWLDAVAILDDAALAEPATTEGA